MNTKDGHFSVAAKLEADAIRSAVANLASWEEVLDWAERNGFRGGVGTNKDLLIINKMRERNHLPPFKITTDEKTHAVPDQMPFKMGSPSPAAVKPEDQSSLPTVRSVQGLVGALFDELDKVRAGKGDEQRIKQVCQLSVRITELMSASLRFKKLERELSKGNRPLEIDE